MYSAVKSHKMTISMEKEGVAYFCINKRKNIIVTEQNKVCKYSVLDANQNLYWHLVNTYSLINYHKHSSLIS